MTRLEWLKKQHTELDTKVTELESEREHIRDYDHKALLTFLKKRRLSIKTEILTLES